MIFNLALCVAIIVIYWLTHIKKNDKEKSNKKFLLFSFIALFILSATREFTIGNDTMEYLNIFERSNIYKWEILNENHYFEPGYLLLNIALSYLNISPRIFLCILSCFFCYSIYKFIKKNSKNYLTSTLLYINLMYFYQSMSMLRQFFALSIVLLLGYDLIKEKKLFKYIGVVIFASLFHTTALLALLIYPIYHMKYKRKTVLAICIGSIVIASSLSEFYPFIAQALNRGSFYLDMIGESKLGNAITTLIFLSIYIFSISIIKPKNKQHYSPYLHSLLFATAIYFISINMAVLERSAQYFAIMSIIALPNIIEENIKDSSKLLINSIVIGLFIIYASIVMINRPEWNTAYNYKTCLLPEESYVCE